MTVAELQTKRAKAIDEARAMMDAAEAEGRTLSEDEQRTWDSLMDEARSHKATLERREALEDEERALEASQGRRTKPIRTATTDDANEYLRSWLLGEAGGRELSFSLRSQPYQGGNVRDWENRAQSFAATEGGELVPQGFVSQLEVALKQYGGVRGAASILRTTSGNDLPWPTANDANQKGELIGVNAPRNEQDVTFGETLFKAYTFSSKAIRVPFELLQDSAVDLAGELGDMLGTRIGRIQNEYYTIGTGTNQPEGIVIGAADSGIVQGTLGTVTYDELIDIEHSVDPAYRSGAKWMFSDATLKAIKKLKDSDGEPLWLSGMKDGAPATVLGYPYVINQDMADLDTVDERSILFGDFTKYKVREVLGVRLIRLDERYADNGQVGFMAHARADGRMLDAGTGPVKAFTNAAA